MRYLESSKQVSKPKRGLVTFHKIGPLDILSLGKPAAVQKCVHRPSVVPPPTTPTHPRILPPNKREGPPDKPASVHRNTRHDSQTCITASHLRHRKSPKPHGSQLFLSASIRLNFFQAQMNAMACRGGDMELMELFLQYLEGNMVGTLGPDMLLGQECFTGPEVGEGKPADHALIYRGGTVTIIEADADVLATRGLTLYPHVNLTTEHALTITRALATLHANTLTMENSSKTEMVSQLQHQTDQVKDLDTTTNTSNYSEEKTTEEETNSSNRIPVVEPGCVKDPWTAQVTRLHVVESNLSILVDALQCSGSNQRTVRRLEALRSDLPTLTQFLQFASAMQTQRIPSVGPICMKDVWIASEDEEEEVLAVRFRGGKDLQGPPLRDAAWVWLTLLGGEMLRERYMELCDEYCNAFNKVLLRQEAPSDIEEISYFDVMRDLGENFLHAFLTILHKFVVSGTWFFDRQLHTDDGLQALADVISFLVDNGIVGSIFVI